MDRDQEIHEIELKALVYGGESIGRLPDGKAVFVPFCLPGEIVSIRILESKGAYARGIPINILKHSPDRIEPRCSHFGSCGGCQYQMMSYEKQLEAKENIFIDQLERIGGFKNLQISPILPNPSPWNYRNNVQFHISHDGRRGLTRMGSHDVIEVHECFLPDPMIFEVWKQLELEQVIGINRVVIRQGEDEDMLLIIEGENGLPLGLEVEMPLSVVYQYPDGQVILAGDDHIIMKVLDREFTVSAGSFFQVNTYMAGKMVEYLLEKLPITNNSILLDVFCGVGLFSAFLAARVKKIIGIEISSESCRDFVRNLDEFDNVELYEGNSDDILPGISVQPDIIILDPPRTGLDRKSLDELIRLSPAMIAYVSCDPSTLARDAKRLCNQGYQLSEIKPFDMFPQTYHIESISIFNKI